MKNFLFLFFIILFTACNNEDIVEPIVNNNDRVNNQVFVSKDEASNVANLFLTNLSDTINSIEVRSTGGKVAKK